METALQTMNINNHDLFLKEVNGQMVVTFRDIDEVHERLEGTARKRFNENKEHFLEGEDYYRLSPSEIRTQNIMCIDKRQTQDIVFLTEFGYLMLVKSLTDKLAWQVQRQLVNGYFRAKSSTTPPLQSTNPLLEQAIMSLQQSQQNLINCVMEQGYQLDNHEKQLEAINESVTNIEKSFEHDFIYADRWDEVQNEFYHLNSIVDDLRKELQNQTVNKALDNNSIDQMDVVRNIIRPLGEKLHDKTIGYKTTYRKVYIAMNVNWKYRMTRWANLNGCKEQLRKIDLVAQDDRLFELFKVTVAKMLEN